MRLEPTVDISGMIEAAKRRGVPLAVLDVDGPDVRTLYDRKLVLVRPDQHVAWRGDEQPGDPLDLVDHMRGGKIGT